MDLLEQLGRLPLPFLARCRVPTDLAGVTSWGEEISAWDTGADPKGVEVVWEAAEALYRTGITPALQLCIRHRGEIVLDRTLGHLSGNAPGDDHRTPEVLATPETPFCLFSSSKLITAMLIHKLDERGLVHLEDRVADYVPGFERHGKQWITLRHLLAHRAGIPNLPPEAMDLELLGHPDTVAELICDMHPSSRAGRLVAYHAISGGFVLGEVVRQVTGKTIREFLAAEICEPLGLRWMNYGVGEADLDKVAINARTGPPAPPGVAGLLRRALGKSIDEVVELSNDPRFLRGIIPAGNVVSNARELTTFLQCLLNDGSVGDVRIFEPRTVRHALTEQSYREIDLTLLMPLRYGLGPMLGDDPVGLFGPSTGRAFGHLGFSNIIPWADPARKISVALLTSGKPIVSTHVVRLFQLLGAINSAFPRQDRPLD
ncbi:MAG: beta-lactamase family protein [Deltaproteobacteria bacterium]|nr:beta-lactamase family protein [Deltaproteobacteria bacterium]